MTLLREIVYVFTEMAPYLLFGFIFAGILHVFIDKDKIIKHLGKNSSSAVFKASLFGVPLPLCSCSVIPTSISLKKNGASNAAVLSFLLSTPLTGVDSIVATYGFLGPVFGIFRPIAAFITGIIGGSSALLINTERTNDMPDEEKKSCCCGCSGKKEGVVSKIKNVFEYAFKTLLDDITVPLITGIVISGVISWIIPENYFTNMEIPVIAQMFLMIIVGIPLYICATSSLPIAAALILKGLSPGVAFVFLVAGPATNSATVALIVKQFGKKFFALYFASISLLSILFGYILNKIIEVYNLSITIGTGSTEGESHSLFFVAIAVLFLILLLASLKRRIIKKRSI